jgi:hypothetical protein
MTAKELLDLISKLGNFNQDNIPIRTKQIYCYIATTYLNLPNEDISEILGYSSNRDGYYTIRNNNKIVTDWVSTESDLIPWYFTSLVDYIKDYLLTPVKEKQSIKEYLSTTHEATISIKDPLFKLTKRDLIIKIIEMRQLLKFVEDTYEANKVKI